MAPEIRFTPDGVPYLVEFSNVTFRHGSASSKSRSQHQRKPIPPQFTHNRLSYLSTSSSLDLSPTADDASGGLYIHFPAWPSKGAGGIPFPSLPAKKTSRSRLLKLRKVIASAVLDAGMDTPAEQKADPLAEAGRRLNVDHQRRQSSFGAPDMGRGAALFSGTYGQVVNALAAAGLAIAPCSESGFEHATRLGALFVVNPTGTGGVEFRKLTLWA
ncbi:hypothetical protein GLOTRDRAFT_123917 [Gloeophyllum trabeum ATCC 11539]|uniref:Uncharacterized protein n=1 Tax=Gloeophyllum trabeum (strain ATCC 11539 / FP-39264 / Madison 617) TaxID=670483 RepID=S7QLE8_GLOTA|nr:uncharacterized protein GLOTRDRAFT_123917 [Gloeophyllum trabeum ATCC 11539]EPQ60162.1 hypothetical protein GLOTRDRAFT_123917 [Gloeophyllum trabeum ATCC 11539]